MLLGPVTETEGRLTDHPMLSVTKKKNKQQNLIISVNLAICVLNKIRCIWSVYAVYGISQDH